MKNKDQRYEFIANPENWAPVEETSHARISEITYKDEKRYKLETFVIVNAWNYEESHHEERAEWKTATYYKEGPGGWRDGLIPQSLTEVREWVTELDRKGTPE